jgi:hypothetical protein
VTLQSRIRRHPRRRRRRTGISGLAGRFSHRFSPARAPSSSLCRTQPQFGNVHRDSARQAGRGSHPGRAPETCVLTCRKHLTSAQPGPSFGPAARADRPPVISVNGNATFGTRSPAPNCPRRRAR